MKTPRQLVEELTEICDKYPYMWDAPLRVQDESGILDRTVNGTDYTGSAYIILSDEA